MKIISTWEGKKVKSMQMLIRKLHENSGEFLKTIRYKDKNFGEKVVGANYDIHVGSILGFPTKIIAFVVSLMIASLPVTGFMICWGRRKR